MAPPPSSDYTSTPSTGKLKLKGVKDAKVDKKKNKKPHHSQKKPRPDEGGDGGGGGVTKNDEDADADEDDAAGLGSEFKDNSVVLKSLADEDAALTKEKRRRRRMGGVDGEEVGPGAAGVVDDEDAELGELVKTEAEKRYDEQRRKRLEERLKREGVKTHKQRVEELNRYLSGLSEHHDMPRIGPG